MSRLLWGTDHELKFIEEIGRYLEPTIGESYRQSQIRRLKNYIQSLERRSIWRVNSRRGGQPELDIDKTIVKQEAESRLADLQLAEREGTPL